MAKVFVSYSQVDSEIADELTEILSSHQIDFFRDAKSIDWGDSIKSEVRIGLEDAAAVLLIVSPASLKSHWVSFEIGYASALGKRILPYLTHPSLEVPGFINDLKYLTHIDQIDYYFSNDFMEEIELSEVSSTSSQVNLVLRFRKLKELMPDLLIEMREDLSAPDAQLIKEFYVLRVESNAFDSEKDRFVYYKAEHDGLLNKIDLIRDYGFIEDVSHGETPIYRMSEEFIELLIHNTSESQQTEG